MNITPINNQNQQSFGIKGFKFKNNEALKIFKELIPAEDFAARKAEILAIKPNETGGDILITFSGERKFSTKKETTSTDFLSRWLAPEVNELNLRFSTKEGGFLGKKISGGVNQVEGEKKHIAENIDTLIEGLKNIVKKVDTIRAEKRVALEAKRKDADYTESLMNLGSDKGLPLPLPPAPPKPKTQETYYPRCERHG